MISPATAVTPSVDSTIGLMSRLKKLLVSACDDCRIMIRLSGSPESTKVPTSPFTMASTDTKTATVRATPRTVISVPTRLTIKLRKLYRMGITFLLLSPAPNRIRNWNTGSVPGGNECARKRNDESNPGGHRHGFPFDIQRRNETCSHRAHVYSAQEIPGAKRAKKPTGTAMNADSSIKTIKTCPCEKPRVFRMAISLFRSR